MDFRLLKASEIDCRVGTVSEGRGFSLLLYKDARVDMKILDEVFGWDGWKREHNLIDGKLFCTVSIWSDKRNEWIQKQDVGTESYTEKEKGQASDAFKRACVNIGIGRELYTAPFIWIDGTKYNAKKDKFRVKTISYNEDREIISLEIVDKKGNVAYSFGSKKTNTTKTNTASTPANVITADQKKHIIEMALNCKVSESKLKADIEKTFGCSIDQISQDQAKRVYEGYRAKYEVMKEKIAENMSEVAPKTDYEK